VMVGAEILGRTLAMLGDQALPLRVEHLLVHVALLRDIRGKISRLPVLINELLLLILMDIQDRLRRKDISLLTPVLAKLRLWREVA
jgi:hypothetical protein